MHLSMTQAFRISSVTLYSWKKKMVGEKAWQQLHNNAASNIEQVQEAIHHKAAAVQAPTTHHKNYPS